jgi:sugar lactone lactonase YvrE
MFRKQVNPKTAAVVTIITLAAIQWFYWRNLVYTPPGRPMAGGGGGPAISPIPLTLGSSAVQVENWVGDEAGYRDGSSWEARLAGPNAVAMTRDGTLLVADSRNHCLRAITPGGRVSTLAGGGPDGAGGNALGEAAAARFCYPSGVAVLADGTIIIADTGNHRLCTLKDARVTLLAGGVKGFADGSGAAARFSDPGPLTVDRSGRIWVVDAGNGKLRAVTSAGAVSTPAQAPSEVNDVLGMVLSSTTQTVWGSTDGEAVPMPSNHRTGHCGTAVLLRGGARAFGDVTKHVIYYQTPGKEPILLAGRLNPRGLVIGNLPETGARATFASPAAVAVGPDGTLYVADYDNNQIRRVRLAGSPYQ